MGSGGDCSAVARRKRAGGLITEVGGILSHGAIVAREYGIPAVMAVRGATSLLADGQQVTVDGNRGVVQIADAASPAPAGVADAAGTVGAAGAASTAGA